MNSFPLESLICYQWDDKIRVGKDGDGGYVIGEGFEYDLLIGCGIADDDSFERAFLEANPKIECYAYDGSIPNVPNPETPRLNFVKKNIAGEESETTTNLHDLISSYSNIFLKMDIEGYEFPWICSLGVDQLNKFKQIAIEFHRPFHEIGAHCLEALARTHYLIHFHGNSCCKTRTVKNITVPNVFECTYIRKIDMDQVPSLSAEVVPSPLDQINAYSEDIHLSGFPYSITTKL